MESMAVPAVGRALRGDGDRPHVDALAAAHAATSTVMEAAAAGEGVGAVDGGNKRAASANPPEEHTGSDGSRDEEEEESGIRLTPRREWLAVDLGECKRAEETWSATQAQLQQSQAA